MKRERKMNKRQNGRLSREILGLLAVTIGLSLVLFMVLYLCAVVVSESYLFMKEIVLDEAQYQMLCRWIFQLGLVFSVGFFVVLFLFLLGERLSYMQEILWGIEALQENRLDYQVPLEGNNELTQLARSVNYLSQTQRELKEKERVMNEEKEQLIRSLSHDIRTPLTSILSCSEFLLSDGWEFSHLQSEKTKGEYLELIRKKALQIRDLTEVLLDGGKRNPEYFEDGRLLMEQILMEFEEALEDEFQVTVDFSDCTAFRGKFDVSELRRITDNLISNVKKYADPKETVLFRIFTEEPVSADLQKQENSKRNLVFLQSNRKVVQSAAEEISQESYKIGLTSIRRIAQHYSGRVDVNENESDFSITITLSEF